MADRDRPAIHVEFFTRPIENVIKSKREGRPIFEDREMIRVRFAGDRNRTFEGYADARAVRDRTTNQWLTYAERFPEHYQAFKTGQIYLGDGTPITELPFLTEAKRAELRALNIHTAESLAAMEGTPLKSLGMGGRELKNQAQAWIDKAKGSADMTRMAAENAALREQMEELGRQIAELAAAKPAPVPAPAPPAAPEGSMFARWSPEEIRAWIAEKTGTRPKANVPHATLVQMADDLARQTPSIPSATVAEQVPA